MTTEHRRKTFDYVAVILASGVALALNVVTAALLYAAIARLGAGGQGLSENATQILTGWGGGIIGVLGAYIGYVGAAKPRGNGQPEAPPPPP